MRSEGFIIKVETVLDGAKCVRYVGSSGLTDDRSNSYRWHYKNDAQMNLQKWQIAGKVSVERYP